MTEALGLICTETEVVIVTPDGVVGAIADVVSEGKTELGVGVTVTAPVKVAPSMLGLTVFVSSVAEETTSVGVLLGKNSDFCTFVDG